MSAKDFGKFPAWCELHAPEELDYISKLCTNEAEKDKLFFKPKENGHEVYYPLAFGRILPQHQFMYVKADILVNQTLSFKGYLSLDSCDVIAIVIWCDIGKDQDIIFYRYDRLVADEENPKAITQFCKKYKISEFEELSYRTDFFVQGEKKLIGKLAVNKA